MKIGEKVLSVKGGKRKLCNANGRCWYEGGPFSGRVVSIQCGHEQCYPDCPPVDARSDCAAVILKADGRKVRVRVANLRPWDAKAFMKVRKEWEGK